MSETIKANGITISYRFYGPEDGPVVVFSNSLISNYTMWDDQVEAITGAGFRMLRCIYLVAMAAMGCGFRSLGMKSRGILAIAALLLFIAPLWMNGLGLVLGIAHIKWQRRTPEQRGSLA